jgi:uncharacterized membrane protein YtjA (UPF0391 family)
MPCGRCIAPAAGLAYRLLPSVLTKHAGLWPGERSRISPDYRAKEQIMLQWALLFLLIALVAAVFGFGGIAASFATIGKILFFVFLVLFLVSLISGAVRRPPA